MTGALDGMVVVDLTRGMDGAFCTKLLADFGADVIQVTRPSSVVADATELDLAQAAALYYNANKRSLVLDYESEHGASLLRSLLAKASVAVEDSDAARTRQLGLDYESLAALKPDLVVTTLTAFGSEGPYSGFAGPDIVRQAVSNFSYQGGLPGREPLRAGANLSYSVAAVAAAIATMMAVCARDQFGHGQHVDVSGVAAMTTCTGFETTKYSYGGDIATFKRDGHTDLPCLIAPAVDGYVCVSIVNDRQWKQLCKFMNMEEFIDDEKFSYTAMLRKEVDQQPIVDRILDYVSHRNAQNLMLDAQNEGIAIVAVPSVTDIITWPQHRDRGFIVTVNHPTVGEWRQPGPPFRMSATPWEYRWPAGTQSFAVDEIAQL